MRTGEEIRENLITIIRADVKYYREEKLKRGTRLEVQLRSDINNYMRLLNENFNPRHFWNKVMPQF